MDNQSLAPSSPRQFGIIDLFAATTLVALMLAMALPFVQLLKQQQVLLLGLHLGIQWLACGGAYLHAASARDKTIKSAGTRIGLGYSGTIAWRHWPVVQSILVMLMLAIAELVMAVGFAFSEPGTGRGFQAIVHQIQLGAVMGYAVARFIWRVYPGAVEFFEAGVVDNGTSLVPWDQMGIRRSQFFPDRIVLVTQSSVPGRGKSTRVVQVSDDLMHRICPDGSSAPSADR